MLYSSFFVVEFDCLFKCYIGVRKSNSIQKNLEGAQKKRGFLRNVVIYHLLQKGDFGVVHQKEKLEGPSISVYGRN